MYIPTIVLLVIVLLVIESVFVHKTSIKLDILDQKNEIRHFCLISFPTRVFY